DDLVTVDRADALNDLFVVDALAARLVNLVESDRRTALGRGIDLDGDRDESEADLPLPVRACGHNGAPWLRQSQRAEPVLVPPTMASGSCRSPRTHCQRRSGPRNSRSDRSNTLHFAIGRLIEFLAKHVGIELFHHQRGLGFTANLRQRIEE